MATGNFAETYGMRPRPPMTSLMAAAVKLASSSVSASVMIRGGPRSTMSPSRPSAHPVEE
jgi:hypothetical protein